MPSIADSSGSTRAKNSGFSLIEVMIAVAAVTILFVLAGPSISRMLIERQVKETSVDISRSLTVAQLEAVSSHKTVRLCPSSDGQSCRNDGDWNSGWIVFADGNSDGEPDRTEILETFDSPNGQVEIRANGAFASEAAFTLNGIVADNDVTTGSFTICPSKAGAESTIVMLDQSGALQRRRDREGCTGD